MKIRKMLSRIHLRCALPILAAALLTANASAWAAPAAACQGLKGTFLQLTEAQIARPAAEWRQLFDELRTIGVNTLFLQWTVLDRKPLFQTARHETAINTPLASILDLAAQSGIRVWFGLALDSSYWEEIKQPVDLLKPYFRRRLRELAGFLDDLNAATAGAPFAGWYIPDEILKAPAEIRFKHLRRLLDLFPVAGIQGQPEPDANSRSGRKVQNRR